jgi:hypothetical protein
MRLRLLIALALALLAACSTTVKPVAGFGSFVPAAQAGYEAQIVDDATRQLVSLYPPASTNFILSHAAQDAFGRQLIDKLRGQGYALQEVVPTAAASTAARAAEANDTDANTSLSYVFDSVPSPRLYRITLIVGGQTISRAYIQQNNLVHPVGSWVRKE